MVKFGVYAGFLKVSPKIKTFVCNVLPDTTLYPALRRPPPAFGFLLSFRPRDGGQYILVPNIAFKVKLASSIIHVYI